jgi:hypothetical protein
VKLEQFACAAPVIAAMAARKAKPVFDISWSSVFQNRAARMRRRGSNPPSEVESEPNACSPAFSDLRDACRTLTARVVEHPRQ